MTVDTRRIDQNLTGARGSRKGSLYARLPIAVLLAFTILIMLIVALQAGSRLQVTADTAVQVVRAPDQTTEIIRFPGRPF